MDGHHKGLGLVYKGNLLNIIEAPEPADIDWEFIHCST